MSNSDKPMSYRLEGMEQVRAAADPFRMQILRALGREARSPKQVAVELGVPPSRIYHHVQVLEKAGLVEMVESRQKRGTVERIYRTTAESFLAPADIFGDQAEASGQVVAERIRLGTRPEAPFQPTTMHSAFRVTPKNAKRFHARLMAALAKLERDLMDPDGEGEVVTVTVVLTSPAEIDPALIG